MSGKPGIERYDREAGIWREERHRADRTLGRGPRAQADIRRHVGFGMVAAMLLIALAVAGVVLGLLWRMGAWVADIMLPHLVHTTVVPAASAETMRAAAGALGWLLGLR